MFPLMVVLQLLAKLPCLLYPSLLRDSAGTFVKVSF